MQAYLMPVAGGEPVQFTEPMLLVGRSPSCDLQMASRKVSRLHCCRAVSGDRLHIRDLDSTNGVKVNDKRVRTASIGPGDQLAIGDVVYRFVTEEADSADGESSALTDLRETAAEAAVPVADEHEATVLPSEDESAELVQHSSSFDIFTAND